MILASGILALAATNPAPGQSDRGAIGGTVEDSSGGIIASVLFRSPGGSFRPAGFVLSVIGALVLLWVYRHYVMH